MAIIRYDVLIENGTLIDPASGLHRKGSIGILKPNIAEIIDPDSCRDIICAQKVIDAKGKYIVPGLVDFHTHVLPSMTFAARVEDLPRHGVVAACDMYTPAPLFSYYRQQCIDKAPIRINGTVALSNVGGLQMDVPEYENHGFLNKKEMIHMLQVHRDVLIGVKVIALKNNCPTREQLFYALETAREVCRESGTRMICHVADAVVSMPELLPYFDEGDVVCHAYHGSPACSLLDENGRVWEAAWEAKKRGVLFDTARGCKHWNHLVGRKGFEQGFLPDIISSDFTQRACRPDSCQLPTMMSEAMAVGMSFEDVLLRCTHAPARLMKGVQVGLEVGNPANITILELEKGSFTFVDAQKNQLHGDTRVKVAATLARGEVLYEA